MPIKPTVFIVGAGASKEVGLPIGSELRGVIAGKVDIDFSYSIEWKSGDRAIYEALRILVDKSRSRIEPYIEAGQAISRALRANLANSIDTFIDHHSDNQPLVAIGKMSIISAILEAEATSRLKNAELGHPPTLSKVSDAWYPSFLNLIGASTKATELQAVFESITIVCFNYDRCIEQYLYYAIRDKFLCTEAEAKALLAKLKIFHPYGTIGRLPWQDGSADRIEFGATPGGPKVFNAYQQIRTFTEQWEDTDARATVEASLCAADALVFLGFGFVPDNIRLLQTSKRCRASDVFFTAIGISESDRRHVRNDLIKAFFSDDKGNREPRFHTAETCLDMFTEHSRGLLNFVQR